MSSYQDYFENLRQEKGSEDVVLLRDDASPKSGRTRKQKKRRSYDSLMDTSNHGPPGLPRRKRSNEDLLTLRQDEEEDKAMRRISRTNNSSVMREFLGEVAPGLASAKLGPENRGLTPRLSAQSSRWSSTDQLLYRKAPRNRSSKCIAIQRDYCYSKRLKDFESNFLP